MKGEQACGAQLRRGAGGLSGGQLPTLPVLHRLLLFSPSVVHLGVPLSVVVQLQDAPPGQVVKGSVFLRNPSSLSSLCSPKVDFTLSSEKTFILLSLQVTMPLLPAAAWRLLLCSLCLPISVSLLTGSLLSLPSVSWSPSLFLSWAFSLCSVSDLPLPLPVLTDPPEGCKKLWPPSPPQRP